MKNIINKRKVSKINGRFKLPDNSLIEDKSIIANRFNNFFVNIGSSLAKVIPKVNKSPKEYLGNSLSESIYLNPVTDTEINEIICKLKNGAPGHDEVPAAVLKDTREIIKLPLCYLCNLSLTQGVFPLELKIANV